jgi:lipopolysaccharide/colanic/teichoic acid biosynthesis glycosyltransferase
MLTDRVEGLMRFSRVTKYTAVAVCCLATAGITAVGENAASAVQTALLPTTAIFLALLACGPSWYSWSRTYFQKPIQTAVRVTVQEILLVGISLLAVQRMMPSVTAATIPLETCVLAVTITLLLLNRSLPTAVSTLMFRNTERPRVLVLGPADATNLIKRQLEVAQAVGLDVVESHDISDARDGLRLFNPKETTNTETQPAPIHSRIHQPDSPNAVDRVVFVRRDDGESTLKLQHEIHRRCNAAGLPLTVYTEEQSTSHHPVTPIPTNAPEISQTAQEPLQNPANQAIKRCMDILISVPFVLFVMPPLCALVRIMQWAQSPGPLFYRQERCGQNGSTFRIFKFRTMHVPEPGQTDIEDNPAPRIFELGAILRDSRLDEIPQFINVLLGSMSIVGPRAHHIQDRAKFSSIVPHYPMRMQAKPGITGPAQYKEYRGVFARNSVASRVACDLEYISQWSIQADVILMLMTSRVIGESLFHAAMRKLYRQLTIAAGATLGLPVLNAESHSKATQNTSVQRVA